MIKLKFNGEISELKQGLIQLCDEGKFLISDDGFKVTAVEGDKLYVTVNKENAEIIYPFNAAFFRGLSMVLQHFGEEWETEETPCFDKNGVMLDCSRNAVLNPETVKYILRKMALMGLNTAMLYTEDTYEIPNEPYFGYMRGKYTQQELKELDDYAYALGIELIPCIQTLSHLERIMKWPRFKEVEGTKRTLFVGEEKTYELIEKMIVAASAPFRTNRIHIGMDEAADVIDGNYRKKHGETNKYEVLRQHLKRVYEILEKHNLRGIMWGDMFSGANKKDVPQELQLVYWNYYTDKEEDYKNGFNIYANVTDNVIFAGGLWTWLGMGVDYSRAMNITKSALIQCRECACNEVFVTAWGDDGGETNLLSALYGMQVYAEYDYTASFDSKNLAERFSFCTGQSADDFLKLTEFLKIPNDNVDVISVWSKILLFEDPLIPLFEIDRAPVDMVTHYKGLYDYYSKISTNDTYFIKLWNCYATLAKALYEKSKWYEIAPKAVRTKDVCLATSAVEQGEAIINALSELKFAWLELWDLTNKPNGFEVIDIRLGGQISRFNTAIYKMKAFAEGNIIDIPELSSEKLTYLRNANGVLSVLHKWIDIVTPGVVVHDM